MGFRFFRRIGLMPGVTLNVSKGGLSVSVGVPGAKLTMGTSGTRITGGLPGTGLSVTKHAPRSASRVEAQPEPLLSFAEIRSAAGSESQAPSPVAPAAAAERETPVEAPAPTTQEAPRRGGVPPFRRALAHIRALEFTEALAALRALEDLPDACFVAGLLELHAGLDAHRAEALLQRAVAAHTELGALFEAAGETIELDLPITAGVHVLILPDRLGATLAWAEALQRLGRQAEAVVILEALSPTRPGDPLIAMSLADLCEDLDG
jgi:hypothetical protein